VSGFNRTVKGHIVTHSIFLLRICAAVCFSVVPVIAAAQTPDASASNQGGPMIVEQVESRAAIVPEYKVSKLDGSTAQLLGGHAGVFVGPVLVGGGLYTLVDGARGQGLTYGGAMIGWQPWTGGRFGLNLRTLVGMGSGTTSDSIPLTTRDGRQVLRTTRRLWDDFFVTEPQVDMLVRLSHHLQLGVGGGYRLTNTSRTDSHRFRGATGSLTLQIASAR
jgi:hypothetical protein